MASKSTFEGFTPKDAAQKTECFCLCYFSKTKCKSTKTIMRQCCSCQNKSVCQNLARSWNSLYALFARKPSISNFTHTVGLINCEHVWPFLVIYCHQWIFQLPSHLQELPSRSYINYVTVLWDVIENLFPFRFMQETTYIVCRVKRKPFFRLRLWESCS